MAYSSPTWVSAYTYMGLSEAFPPTGPFAMTNGSGTFYYHADPLRTVTDVTDASGAAQWKYEYDAYGVERDEGLKPVVQIRRNLVAGPINLPQLSEALLGHATSSSR
jgi:hypothetical protein